MCVCVLHTQTDVPQTDRPSNRFAFGVYVTLSHYYRAGHCTIIFNFAQLQFDDCTRLTVSRKLVAPVLGRENGRGRAHDWARQNPTAANRHESDLSRNVGDMA